MLVLMSMIHKSNLLITTLVGIISGYNCVCVYIFWFGSFSSARANLINQISVAKANKMSAFTCSSCQTQIEEVDLISEKWHVNVSDKLVRHYVSCGPC